MFFRLRAILSKVSLHHVIGFFFTARAAETIVSRSASVTGMSIRLSRRSSGFFSGLAMMCNYTDKNLDLSSYFLLTSNIIIRIITVLTGTGSQ